MEVLLGIGSVIGKAGSAIGSAVTGGGMAASGINLASILQGTATVLGVASSIGAGKAEADAMAANAIDADREQEIQTLSGIERRGSIKRALADAVGAQDVAFAASGVDLSFGTASQARTDAFREADLSLTSASSTEQTRASRLMERAANYRAGAKRARRGGLITGLTGGLKGAADIAGRY